MEQQVEQQRMANNLKKPCKTRCQKVFRAAKKSFRAATKLQRKRVQNFSGGNSSS